VGDRLHGARWEWYVKTGDEEVMDGSAADDGGDAVCCTPAVAEPIALGVKS
jgi:hypothetical protein